MRYIFVLTTLVSLSSTFLLAKNPGTKWKINVLGHEAVSATTATKLIAPKGQKTIILRVKISAPRKNQAMCKNYIILSSSKNSNWPLAFISSDITKNYCCLELKVEKGTIHELVEKGETMISLKTGLDGNTKKTCTLVTFTKQETQCFLVFFVPTDSAGLKLNFNGQIIAIPKK